MERARLRNPAVRLRLGYVWGIEISCSPFLVALLFFSAVSDNVDICILGGIALVAHEFAHIFIARSLGYRVYGVELLPFGCAAHMEESYSAKDAGMIALAGPILSIVTACICYAALNFGDFLYVRDFGNINLAIALINLFPAYPLDGGRVLKSLLRKRAHPEKTCSILGIFLAAVLILSGAAVLLLGSENLTLLIFGIFLLIAAVQERRGAGKNGIRDAMQKGVRLRRGEPVEIRQIAVHKDTTVNEAYRMLQSQRYSVICVLDDEMRVIGSLDEGRLVQCILERRTEISLRDVIDL